MKILISGATGFIGGFLRTYLLELGHELIIVTREPKKYDSEKADNQQFITWDATTLISAMQETDVVINLAGESIFGQRWTDDIKRRLMNSRVDSTKMLVDAAKAAESKPSLFISASAVGIYGDSADKLLSEDSEVGDDFLAKICIAWEEEAQKIESSGVRLAIPRIGIVLHPDDGALKKMVLPFKLFAGGPIGDGEQYVPWIHIHDAIRAIAYPIENDTFKGPYNVCAPEAVSNEVLSFNIGKVLNRPSWLAAPKFALNIILGEAAQPVLNSLRVKPEALLEAGFNFTFEDLEETLADLL